MLLTTTIAAAAVLQVEPGPTSLSDALAQALPGDELHLAPGTYDADVTVSVPVTVISQVSLGARATGTWTLHDGVVVRGVHLQGTDGVGVVLRGGATLEQSQVEGYRVGVRIRGGGGVVRRNRIVDVQRGVELVGAGPGVPSNLVIVEENFLAGRGHGVGLAAVSSRWLGARNLVLRFERGAVLRDSSTRLRRNALADVSTPVVTVDGQTQQARNAVGCGLAGAKLAPDLAPTCAAGPYLSEAWWQDMRCAGAMECPFDAVDSWLAANPSAADTLSWWTADTGWVGWSSWPEPLRADLAEVYDREVLGIATPLAHPPTNLATPSGAAFPTTRLAHDDAKALFFSLVATSLRVEVEQRVPWSLLDLDDNGLRTILDGNRLFWPDGVGDMTLSSSRSLPAPGPETLDWLEQRNAIGTDRLDTIGHLLQFSREEMTHFLGSFSAEVAAFYWNYPGAVDALAVMHGTDPVGTHPTFGSEAGHRSYTAGCHGTNTFYREVLRVVNIPVVYETAAGHAIPSFPTETRWLSHGDDPYNVFARDAPYDATEMLIDQATHDDWFVNTSALPNVGRQVAKLAALHPPFALLQDRCDDIEGGVANADGSVFGFLQKHYTLAELDAMGFWASIDAEIAAGGGCANF